MGIFAILANILGLGVQGAVAYSKNKKVDKRIQEMKDSGHWGIWIDGKLIK
jgi:hypothetical protein